MDKGKKRPLLILTGPTAVGKTALSIALAKLVKGEIISADSMQVYRGMDIGSAKITKEEMQGVVHHLIDILEPDEEFNVTVFQKLCREAMDAVYSRGHIPILVGGTGFYIQAVLYGVDFSEEKDETQIRKQLEKYVQEHPVEAPRILHEKLAKVDPQSAKAIHENNIKRVIRALEYYEINKEPISSHNAVERQKESQYNSVYFVLDQNRDILYKRIELRVDKMLQDGLVNEVKGLKDRGFHKNMVAMQGIGYKEILEYLEGESSLCEAVEKIKLNTRHFAKRQLTWFRREKDVVWIPREDYDNDEAKILKYMLSVIRSRGIE